MNRARIPTDLKNTLQLLYANVRTSPTFSPADAVPIRRGVLQGGVLSPDLFNRYVDDLAERLKNKGFEAFFYADDLAIITFGELGARQVITVVTQWCNLNHMQLNKDKCGVMFLSTGHSTLNNWEIRQKTVADVPIVATYKYLGVHLQKNLQPTVHLEYLREKLARFQKMTFILRAHNAPQSVNQMLWKVFQLTRLNYAGFLFSTEFATESMGTAFRTLHRKTLKYALGLPKGTWESNINRHVLVPVSYTHLTLPTTSRV